MNITTANSGTFGLIRILSGNYGKDYRPIWPYLLAILGALAVVWPGIAKAEMRSDLAAHAGATFAINTISYGFFSKVIKMPRPIALGFSAATTGIISIAKEATDLRPDEADLWADGVGILTSHLVVLMFEF